MKTFKVIMLISSLLLFPVFSHSQTLGDVRISLIDGDVQIRTEDTDDWVPASINMPLREGDRIWVPEGGKTELQLRDGTYLRLDEKSALEILTLDKDSFQFYLTEGHAYANFKGRKGSLLQMDTPISSVRAYDRSIFRMDIADDGLTQVSVFRGTVDAESRTGKTTIRSGYTLALKEETYAELSPLGPPDEWERWNSERDRRLAERRPPSVICPRNCMPIPVTLKIMEGGCMRVNMDMSGRRGSLFLSDGLPTGLAGGCGSLATMSGYLMNPGVGCPITTDGGLLLPR